MSDLQTGRAPARTRPQAKPKRFGFSALLTGFTRMWRGFIPVVVIVLVNAGLQALLTYWNPQVSLSFAYVAAFMVSAAMLILWLAVLSRTALEAVDSRIALSEAFSSTVPVLGRFAVWAVVQWVLVLAGFLIFPLLGLLFGILTVFVPLAAADGQANAFGANVRAIRDRPGRWLLTSAICLVLAAVLLLLSAVNVFFIHGTAAAFIFWTVIGFVASWLLTAFAAIYRSTRVGSART